MTNSAQWGRVGENRQGFYRRLFTYLVLFDDGTVELYWQVTAARPVQHNWIRVHVFDISAVLAPIDLLVKPYKYQIYLLAWQPI